jgi:Uma2 family endonuclease
MLQHSTMKGSTPMAVDPLTLELKLVREADSLELDLRPLQGLWTEQQYLRLTDQTNHLIEFVNGVIEVLPMPTDHHQVILLFLYDVLRGFLQRTGGKVLVAPIRLQIQAGRFREPDILLVRDASDPRRENRYWLGADLVVEIVSPDDPERDTVAKRADYAEAGIPEYWIVNSQDETITVLQLLEAAYTEYSLFRRGDVARSVLLDGLSVPVDDVLDAR